MMSVGKRSGKVLVGFTLLMALALAACTATPEAEEPAEEPAAVEEAEEEVAEEPKLPDRLIRHAGVDVGRLHCFVDDRPSVAAFEHPAHLAFVILTRIEPTFSYGLRQFCVRS